MELLKDPKSETESEPEQDGDAIYQLSKEKCKDRARGDPVRRATEDGEKSNTKGAEKLANLCWQHCNVHRAKRGARKCARLGCHNLGRVMSSGVLTCLEHDLAPPPVGPPAEPVPAAAGIAPERARAARTRSPPPPEARRPPRLATSTGAWLAAMVRGPQGADGGGKYYLYQ